MSVSMPGAALPGLHHITAIASDPQKNVDFYVGALGLRLVKKTVNFDDPGTYHLYYGDAQGSPGTILTFFPWPGAAKGRRGAGETTVTALSVPDGTLPYWQERLARHGIETLALAARFDEQYFGFADPDGMRYELVTRADGPDGGPEATAIRGIDGVTIMLSNLDATERLLTETLGFARIGEDTGRVRFAANSGKGSVLDILIDADATRGSLGAGTVHHIAWRTPDDATEEKWLETLSSQGYHVSPVMDRQYFHSIYFREPGGVLFEIATDPPGFAADEAAEALGATLKLPSWLESRRPELELRLAPLRLPDSE